ncbi:hypothetical protein Y032_0007g3379 [Ancylostoma ceylanicum]|uniref:Uncharacterized protein n=1 Tax=Ancylostoma ceylanicum TaxID=53326 RepID=A0A016VMR9_9BILA|nr:hypothetical protein Y032_0007g3379 [Ancylostoma ceylanicum]
MVWSLSLLPTRPNPDLLPYLTLLSLQISTVIMVFHLICCLKRSNIKGGSPTAEHRTQKGGCCMRKSKDQNTSRATRALDSWKNSISDISTCDIVNPPSVDCGMGDAGLEAKIRHRTLTWYPELKLQPRSIIRKNYMKFDRSLITKHPPHANVQNALSAEEMKERREKYKDKHITWEPDCPVFVVYGFDPCRGELEYDENTMDDLSFREAEEIEKSVDKALLPHTPNKETTKPKGGE